MKDMHLTVLVPHTVTIPASKVADLIRSTEDYVAAQTGCPEGTPQICVDDLIDTAILEGVISLPPGWEMPTDGNHVIDKGQHKTETRSKPKRRK